MYVGLAVEFNILEVTGHRGNQTRAVRIRPLTIPLTIEERRAQREERERKEVEQRQRERAQRKQHELDIRQNMIDEHPMTNQDGRVRFMEFGGSSLDVMIIFYVDSANWDDFINTKEDINYKIMEIVEKHNSSFAFPSRSVYIEKKADDKM